MDWSLITGVVGGALGGNVVTQFIAQWHAGRQKNSERSMVRIDANRTELRDAYAQFIVGVDDLLEMGREYISLYKRAADVSRRVRLAAKELADMEAATSRVGVEVAETEVAIRELERTSIEALDADQIQRLREKHEHSLATNHEIGCGIEKLLLSGREGLDHLNMECAAMLARSEPLAMRWPAVADQIRSKGVMLHLLESNALRRTALDALLAVMVPNPMRPEDKPLSTKPEDVELYVSGIMRGQDERARRRDELMKLLAGMDAP